MPQVRIAAPHIRAVNRFEKAVEAKSWAGAQPPEDWPAIEAEYKKAKELLLNRGRLKAQGQEGGSATFKAHQREFDQR